MKCLEKSYYTSRKTMNISQFIIHKKNEIPFKINYSVLKIIEIRVKYNYRKINLKIYPSNLGLKHFKTS